MQENKKTDVTRTPTGTTREHGPRAPRQPNFVLRRIGAGAVAAAALVTGYNILSPGSSDGETPPPTTVVVAEPGDTIWSLQRAEANLSGLDPNSDIRREVDKSIDLNNGTEIEPGQQVTVVDIADK